MQVSSDYVSGIPHNGHSGCMMQAETATASVTTAAASEVNLVCRKNIRHFKTFTEGVLEKLTFTLIS